MIADGFAAQRKPEESLLLKLQNCGKHDWMQATTILLGVFVNAGDKSNWSSDGLVQQNQFVSCQLQCNKALWQHNRITACSLAYELTENT